MLTDLLLLIINAVSGFFTSVLLARFYMQWARVSFRNQIGQFVIQLTDWAVLPARRVIPALLGLDTATLGVAWAVQVLVALLGFLLKGQAALLSPGSLMLVVAVLGLVEILRLTVWFLIIAVLAGAVLSWVAPYNPAAGLLAAMTRPFLGPIQRRMPPIANVDLSPLVLILLLQIVLYLLETLQRAIVPLLI